MKKKTCSKCERLACVNGMFKAIRNTERPDTPGAKSLTVVNYSRSPSKTCLSELK